MVLAFALLLSCASGIRALYDDERAAALATAGPPAGSFDPDVRVRIAPDALDDLVETAVDQGLGHWSRTLTLQGPAGLDARLEPRVRLTSLDLTPSRQCDGCLSIDARARGKARWSAVGRQGSVPVQARIQATFSFDLQREDDTWHLRGRLRDVDSVRVSSASVGTVDAAPLLGDWVADALAGLPELDLGRYGGAGLPLAAARLSTAGGILEVDLLTDLVDRVAVPPGARLDEDWEVRVSAGSLLGLARRAAFQAGPLTHDVSPIPTALSVTGDELTLGLRLWRIEGRGWWRDYTVEGTLRVADGALHIQADRATEGERSPGAGVADPLALLVEGRILEAIVDGMQRSIPASKAVAIGDARVQARLEEVQGSGDTIVARGSLRRLTGALPSGGGALPR